MIDLSITYFLYLSSALFALGLFGVMTQRNAVRILISVEIMLNAANINFAAVASYKTQVGSAIFQWDYTGWSFVILIIALAAAEAAIGLAIFISAFRAFGEIDIGYLYTLKGNTETEEF